MLKLCCVLQPVVCLWYIICGNVIFMCRGGLVYRTVYVGCLHNSAYVKLTWRIPRSFSVVFLIFSYWHPYFLFHEVFSQGTTSVASAHMYMCIVCINISAVCTCMASRTNITYYVCNNYCCPGLPKVLKFIKHTSLYTFGIPFPKYIIMHGHIFHCGA